MLRKALLAATALVAVQFCAPAPARAEPISTAIGLSAAISSTLGVSAAVAGAIGGTLIGGAISLGLSFLNQALTPKAKAGEANSGVETSVQLGGDVARQIPIGRCSLKGQLAYVNTYADDNNGMHQVFVLGDWPTEGLVEMWMGGKKYVPQQDGSGQGWKSYHLDEFPGRIAIWYYDGTQTAANAELVATANPPGRWTENSKLTGLSYVIVGYAYDKYSDLYADGIPQWSFVVDGAKLYDRRRDDTAGGSGPQRWAEPETWEFSANPAVARENYLRGFWRGDRLLLGMGVPAYDLVGDSFVAAANAADEPVETAAGGTEPRYRCGMVISADEGVTHKQVLDAINATDAGYLYEAAGLYVCQAGVAQGVVRTITDDDLLVGESVTYAAKRSRAELVNTIHGQFLDPKSGWQPQSYTPRSSAADIAVDGEELGKLLDLMSVSSQSPAERIAEIRRREARAQATGSIPLGFQHRDLIPGDWLRWNSARFGFSKVFRIAEREVRQANRSVRLTLEETAASVYAWGAEDEGVQVPIPIRPGAPLLASTVSDFEVVEFQAVSADGRTEIPGIRATWRPVTDSAVDEVVIQLRIVGATEIRPFICPSPGDGEYIVVGGLVPATEYEARATIRTTPLRLTTFTPWRPVLTGASRARVSLEDLDNAVTEVIEAAGAAADRARDFAVQARTESDLALQEMLAQLLTQQGAQHTRLTHVAQTTSERIDEAGVVATELRRSLISLSDMSQARYDELIQAIATGDTATVTRIILLEATVGDPETGLAKTRGELAQFKQAQATRDEAMATAYDELSAEVRDPATGLAKTRGELVQFEQTQATTNTAVSQALNSLSAAVDQNTAGITSANQARADGDNALAIIANEAKATANGVSASGRMAVQVRAGANGTDVVLAFVASRTAGGATVDAGLYIVIDQYGNSRIVLDTARVQIGGLNDATFPFEFVDGQLRLKSALIAPGAIAGSKYIDVAARDMVNSVPTGGGAVDMVIPDSVFNFSFGSDVLVDFEVTLQVEVQNFSNYDSASARCIFQILDANNNVMLTLDQGAFVGGIGVGTWRSEVYRLRQRVPMTKNTAYSARFVYRYNSTSSAFVCRLMASNASYQAVILS